MAADSFCRFHCSSSSSLFFFFFFFSLVLLLFLSTTPSTSAASVPHEREHRPGGPVHSQPIVDDTNEDEDEPPQRPIQYKPMKILNGHVPTPPPDAPVSRLAPVHLHSPSTGIRRPGEWLVMVHKAFRGDFVGVLEEMGDHLAQRFGMRGWFNTRELRERERWSEGQLKVRDAQHGHSALQIDQRMLVRITVPDDLIHREKEIIRTIPFIS